MGENKLTKTNNILKAKCGLGGHFGIARTPEIRRVHNHSKVFPWASTECSERWKVRQEDRERPFLILVCRR